MLPISFGTIIAEVCACEEIALRQKISALRVVWNDPEPFLETLFFNCFWWKCWLGCMAQLQILKISIFWQNRKNCLNDCVDKISVIRVPRAVTRLTVYRALCITRRADIFWLRVISPHAQTSAIMVPTEIGNMSNPFLKNLEIPVLTSVLKCFST